MTTAAPNREIAPKRKTLPELLNDDDTQKRFEGMLGKDARSFAQNILTVYNGSKSLQECDPESIIAACAISASIGLSILPSLGHSCVVPYKDGDRKVAQWQLMYKGGIQLAQRSGRYAKINLARVYEGQLVKHDEFKGEVTLDASKKKSDRVEGYYFFFRLLDGYVHEAYWSAKKCVEHGLRFSKSMQAGNGKWTEDPEFAAAGSVKKWLAGKTHFLTEGSGADAMSAKTPVKIDLLKWGPLETRIKETMSLDQAVIGADGTPRYIDTTAEPTAETSKPTPPPTTNKGEKPAPDVIINWARAAAGKQGVTEAQFDAWLKEQTGDESTKADAAEKAWKRVAAKQATAAEVFAVKTQENNDAEEKTGRFQVSGHATTDVDGDPDWFAIKDSAEPANKYVTKDPAIFEAAKEAKKADKNLNVIWTPKVVGKNTLRLIVRQIA